MAPFIFTAEMKALGYGYLLQSENWPCAYGFFLINQCPDVSAKLGACGASAAPGILSAASAEAKLTQKE